LCGRQGCKRTKPQHTLKLHIIIQQDFRIRNKFVACRNIRTLPLYYLHFICPPTFYFCGRSICHSAKSIGLRSPPIDGSLYTYFFYELDKPASHQSKFLMAIMVTVLPPRAAILPDGSNDNTIWPYGVDVRFCPYLPV